MSDRTEQYMRSAIEEDLRIQRRTIEVLKSQLEQNKTTKVNVIKTLVQQERDLKRKIERETKRLDCMLQARANK